MTDASNEDRCSQCGYSKQRADLVMKDFGALNSKLNVLEARYEDVFNAACALSKAQGCRCGRSDCPVCALRKALAAVG